MREERLLERIKRWDAGEAVRSHQFDYDLLKVSIHNHLMRILNTRQGGVLMDPAYGIPDFSHLSEVGPFLETVKQVIERYETRLINVVVGQPDGVNQLGFANLELYISGDIAVEDGRQIPVKFTTLLTSSGRVRVKY